MTTPIKEKAIESLEEFIAYLKPVSANRRLFRGHNFDESLLPQIIILAQKKKIKPNDLNKIEKRMLERFRKESIPLLTEKRVFSDMELLSIAQHHGMPTRLLDWTANPLAGLWFAMQFDSLKDMESAKKRKAVWMIEDPKEIAVDEITDIFSLAETSFFKPPHLDRRIAAQSAWFSIYRHNKEQYLPIEKQSKFKRKLTKFTIDNQFFQSIREDLRMLNVNHFTMFPDLSGLCLDIQAKEFD